MLKGPFVGGLFSLSGMKIKMVPSKMVKFMGEECGEMIEKSGIVEFPSIDVSFRSGEYAISSVKSHTDQFKLSRQIGRDFPFTGKSPFAFPGNETGRRHPSAHMGSTSVLTVSGYDVECHDKIACVCILCDTIKCPDNVFPMNTILSEKVEIMKQMYLHGSSYSVC